MRGKDELHSVPDSFPGYGFASSVRCFSGLTNVGATVWLVAAEIRQTRKALVSRGVSLIVV